MFKRFSAVFLFVCICTGLTGVVFSQSTGNACIKEKIGGNPPCTANDVRIGKMEIVGAAPQCVVGTSVNVPIKATIESGPDRWDIGLWVNQAGNSALSDPTGNNCYRDYLHPDNAPTTCNQQGGPYYKGDPTQALDVCGDVYAQNTNPCGNAVIAACTGMGGDCLFTTFTFTSSIFCADDNGDGTVDVGNCTSWDNNIGGVCTSELGTDPGTVSKCNCSTLNVQGLICTPTAEICDGLDNDCDGLIDEDNVCTDCRVPTNPSCPASDECASYTCNQNTGECDTVYTPSTTTCRPSAGPCDVAESCTGSSKVCPLDGFQASTTTCRPSTGQCDAADSCTGNSAACPADGFQSVTTACVGGSNGGACDGTDSCDGAGNCVDGFVSATSTCRPSAGQCDVAESCTGSSGACPADGFQSVTTACVGGSNGGACDGTDSCDGAGNCVDGFVSATSTCRPSAGQCDVAESCTGSSGTCPADGFQSVTTACVGGSNGGACDGTDSCDGSGNCVDGFVSATSTCRPSAGQCDVAESCTGSSGTCPADGFQSVTTACVGGSNGGACDGTDSCDGSGNCVDGFVSATSTCRPSAGQCDVAESCTGSSGACPADGFQSVTTACVGGSNGGACDGTDSCDGAGNCVDGFVSATSTCRPSAGQCDVAESCTGSSGACPADGFQSVTTACVGGSNGGACDGTDSCDGAGNCVDGFVSATSTCRPSAGQCDVAESCTGSSGACPADGFQAVTTACVGGSNGGACDGTDSCDGAGNCVDGFVSATSTCRPSAGQCDVAESCTGSSGTCPADGFQSVTTACVGGSNGGACDGTDSCDGAGNCVDGFVSATSTCRPSAGQCDVAESCTGSSGACPADGFQSVTTACVGGSNGGACDGTDSCDGAGNCVDGFVSATSTCRPSAGQCDVAESCTGSSGTCPADGFQSVTTACVGGSNGGACDGTDSCDGSGNCVDGFVSATSTCRPSAGQCDVAESCTGSSGTCPADGFQSVTTACVGGSNGGACDGTDSCDGSGNCVDGFVSATSTCRPSAGQCDVAESCTGSSGTCPADGFQSVTTACVGGSNGGACDGTDSCDGSGNCVDGFVSATSTCRPSAGQCDVAESCTGSSGACPADGFESVTTACVGGSNGGACDGTDSCDGSGNCVDGFVSATSTCRPSAGQCDVAESCTGSSGACPADGFQSVTTACVGGSNGGACDGTDSCDGAGNCVDGFVSATSTCRPSAGQCDVAESCTGSSGACPADGFQSVTTACVGGSNGGACDGTDSCDGAGNCVDGFQSPSTVCRPSAGQCDIPETCNGQTGLCPADTHQPATTTCVGTSNGGACDGTDSCDGAGNCADGFVPATTTCRPSAGQCDVAESCTGSSGTCPANGFQPATTTCVGTSNGGACDGTDSCNGSGTCVDGFQSATTTCRPAAGPCDVAESCTGSAGTCPADGFQPGGTACTSDGNGCTSDVCNATGTCTHTSNGTCGGKITPTGTTCDDFRTGIAADLNQSPYTTKGTAINAATPGVMFYYSTIIAPSASFTINVTQTITPNSACSFPNWPPLAPQSLSQANLYSASCGNRATANSFDPTTGTVTMSVTGATPGETLIIGIKYQISELKGTNVCRPHPTETYTFGDSFGNGDTLVFVPKN